MRYLKLTVVLIVFSLGLGSCSSSLNSHLKDGLYAKINTKQGDVLVQLYYKKVPITVANFISLAEGENGYVKKEFKGKHFYDGLKFHRVISKANGDQQDFMIQGGDPLGNGSGGPGYTFKDEFPKDSVGKLMYDFSKPDMLAMANSGPATNGSQFFITIVPTTWLNGKHTVFGHVIEGQNIVKTAKKGDIIEKIKIIRKGKEARNFNASKVFSDYMDKNIASRKALLDKFASQKEKAIKLKSGLQLFIQKQGEGKMPVPGETVGVNYTGYLTTGKIFDSSIKRGVPISFPVGMGRVIKGWDEGIMHLKEGSKATLFIPSYLAYGAQGAGGVIPPNADLIFEVELVKVGK